MIKKENFKFGIYISFTVKKMNSIKMWVA